MINPDEKNHPGDLRQRAEEQARQKADQHPEILTPAQTQALLHELQGHQIELEMQNEELRAAQAELEASQARYFDLYDLAPVGYCTLSEKGLILEANLTAATLFSVPRSALVKQPLTRFILPEDEDIYYLHRKQLFETGKPQVCELRMFKKDGSPFWAHLEVAAAQVEDGEPVCKLVISDITERKRVEDVLNESAKRLELANKATNDVVWDWDVIQDTQQWNEAGRTVFGWTEIVEHPVNAHWWVDRVHPDDRQRVHDTFFAVVNNPQFDYWSDEYRFMKADGNYADVIDRGYVLRDVQGKAIRMVGAMLDITERKQAEKALRESEERYRTLFDASPTAILVVKDGRYVLCNPAGARNMGYPDISELLGKPALETIDPQDHAIILERMQRIGSGQNNQPLEIRLIRKDGSLAWSETTSSPITLDGEQAALVIGQDITERKRAEQALRQAEIDRALILDATSEIFMFIDLDLQIQWCNRASGESVGLPVEEMIGKHCYEIWHARSVPCEDCPLMNVMATSKPQEAEKTTPDGRLWLLRSYPVFDDSGDLHGLVELGQDITIRKQAEMKIHTALREKEALLREIHHRVKNNLNLVTSLLDLQSSTILDEQAQRAFLESQSRIRAIARLHEAIYRSADLARIDPGDYLQDLCHHLMIAYARKQDNISLLVDIEPLWLDLDTAVPCGLILNELVSNALKHAFPPGWQAGETGTRQPEVRVSLRRVDDLLELEVTDNGIGLPPEVELAAISTLGLQLVSMFAQQLEGKFELQRLTRGSRFCVSFPAPVLTEG